MSINPYHVLPVQVYYEDTDHSGVVYHANYLKYFERSREHMLGVDKLVRLWEDEGVGFVVYQIQIKYKAGAKFGDCLEVRTTCRIESPYRAVFDQQVWLVGADRPMVSGEVHLACVNREQKLVRLPESVVAHLQHQ